MEQAPETVVVLQQIVGETSDDERRRIEAANIKPYDSGLHDEDPTDQPSETSEIEP